MLLGSKKKAAEAHDVSKRVQAEKKHDITLAKACSILGISRTEFYRRMEARTISLPGTRSAKGKWSFRIEDVRTLARTKEYVELRRAKTERIAAREAKRLESPSSVGGHMIFDGEQASVAYKAFREGKSVEDVVIDHEMSPDIAAGLYRAWLSMRGALALSAEDVRVLDTLPMVKDKSIVDASTLMSAMTATFDAKPDACLSCRKRHARYCHACAAQVVMRSQPLTSRSTTT